MIAAHIIDELTEIVAPMAEAMGLVLWGIEATGGEGRPILRIYLDGEDGVDVDQCARLSRDLSVVLDVEDIVPGSFNLEVSSPGLDRPFFSLDQMRGNEGKSIKVQLLEPFQGSKNFVGTLDAVGEDGFTFTSETSGDALDFAFSEVKKVNVRYQFPAKNTGRKA